MSRSDQYTRIFYSIMTHQLYSSQDFKINSDTIQKHFSFYQHEIVSYLTNTVLLKHPLN